LRSINPDAEFSARSEPLDVGPYGEASLPRPVTHEKNAYTHDCTRIRNGGLNAQLSDPAAAAGRSQLRRLDQLVARRRAFAERLDAGLGGIDGVRLLTTPDGHRHAHHLYTFLLDSPSADRDQFVRDLEEQGVEIILRYFPVHLLPEWRARGGELGAAPVAERIWFTRLVNLPISPQLGPDDADFVVEAVERAMAAQERARRVVA
jgi:dTDP-4-amino-4,6-dideoxygalactose transaminase